MEINNTQILTNSLPQRSQVNLTGPQYMWKQITDWIQKLRGHITNMKNSIGKPNVL